MDKYLDDGGVSMTDTTKYLDNGGVSTTDTTKYNNTFTDYNGIKTDNTYTVQDKNGNEVDMTNSIVDNEISASKTAKQQLQGIIDKGDPNLAMAQALSGQEFQRRNTLEEQQVKGQLAQVGLTDPSLVNRTIASRRSDSERDEADVLAKLTGQQASARQGAIGNLANLEASEADAQFNKYMAIKDELHPSIANAFNMSVLTGKEAFDEQGNFTINPAKDIILKDGTIIKAGEPYQANINTINSLVEGATVDGVDVDASTDEVQAVTLIRGAGDEFKDLSVDNELATFISNSLQNGELDDSSANKLLSTVNDIFGADKAVTTSDVDILMNAVNSIDKEADKITSTDINKYIAKEIADGNLNISDYGNNYDSGIGAMVLNTKIIPDLNKGTMSWADLDDAQKLAVESEITTTGTMQVSKDTKKDAMQLTFPKEDWFIFENGADTDDFQGNPSSEPLKYTGTYKYDGIFGFNDERVYKFETTAGEYVYIKADNNGTSVVVNENAWNKLS